MAAGQPLWREQTPQETPPTYAVPPENPMKGTVYILTDFRCGSACLNAVDLWKTLGAVQIGRETNADTVYMELHEAALPSDMADEPALQAWVRELNAAD